MTDRRSQLQEKYEDALFALIMDEYLRQQGKQAFAEYERLKESNEIEQSQVFNNRIEKQIQHSFNSMKRKQRKNSMRAIAKRVGLSLCAAVMLTMTVFAAFPTLKNNVMNLWLDITDEYVDFHFFSENDAEISTEGSTAPDDFVVTWLPDGFQLESRIIMPSSVHYKYTAPGDKVVNISKYINDGGTLSIDVEDAEQKHMQLNGMDALLTQKECKSGTGEKQNEITLTWWDVEKTIIMRIIAVDISEREVIGIAEGIQEQ